MVNVVFCYFISSWFMHFYLVGVAWTSLLLLILTNTCFGNSSEIPLLKYFIYLIMPSPNREPQVNCASVLLGLLLLLFQVSRRLYECLFVSIFSGRIHIVHYFVGIGFYLLVGATVASPMVKIHEGKSKAASQGGLQYKVGVRFPKKLWRP